MKQAVYFRQGSWPRKGPEWVIWQEESFEPPLPEAKEFTDGAGNAYDFKKAFPAAPLAGLHWFVYQNRAR